MISWFPSRHAAAPIAIDRTMIPPDTRGFATPHSLRSAVSFFMYMARIGMLTTAASARAGKVIRPTDSSSSHTSS